MDIKTIDNETLVKQIEEAGDMTEVVSALKNAGINTTEEELMSKLAVSDEELSEDNLEAVVGGANFLLISPLITYALRKVILNKFKKGSSGYRGPFTGGGSR